MFTIKTIIKHIEEDNFENGCTGEAKSIHLSSYVKTNTQEELIKECMDMAGTTDRSSIELNACEEIGRLDIQVTKTAGGATPSKQTIAEWKKGKAKLYLCTYSFYCEEFKPVEFTK